MEITIEQALQEAITFHSKGDLFEAEKLYKAILEIEPSHSDANHNLGLILVSANKYSESLPFFEKALELKPYFEQYWLSYINALIRGNFFKKVEEILSGEAKKLLSKDQIFDFKRKIDLTKVVQKKSKNDLELRKNKKLNNEDLQINKLSELYEKGRFDEAEDLAITLTQDFPKNKLGWKFLGVLLSQKACFDQAVLANNEALKLSQNDPEIYNNLGIAMRGLGRLESAEEMFKKAISLNSGYAPAYNNLGNLYQGLNKLKDAENIFNQALKIKKDSPEIYNNLGIVLQGLGNLKEAEKCFKIALDQDPKQISTIMNLGTLYHYMDEYNLSIDLFKKVIDIDPINNGLRAGVNIALFNFLNNDFVNCRKYLLASTKIKDRVSLKYKNEKIYHNYLSKLLKWQETKFLDKNLSQSDSFFIIGESHALTSHWVNIDFKNKNFLGRSFLVKGVKQWHLGNLDYNKYKNKFETIFKSLEKKSNILLAIGEIDCRFDDGIIKYKNKNPEKNINHIIENTIKNYLSYIQKLNKSFSHEIIIQGVPCPNINLNNLHKDKRNELIDLIRNFNFQIMNKSKDMDFGFLDVYKLTDRGDGRSNKVWHVDDIHISAEGVQEAWRNFYYE